MKQNRTKILSVALMIVLLASLAGCGGKEADMEQEENLQQEDGQSQDTGEPEGTDEPENTPEAGEDEPFTQGEYPEPVLFNGDCVFDHEVWKKEVTNIGSPGGILFSEDHLFVCDMENHCVVRLSADGEFMESYGELGSEQGNFIQPTAILLHENEVYVLDSGNTRIQVFDSEMNFIREILFEGISMSSAGKYRDMAVAGDGTIYIATDSVFQSESGIFYIEDGALCRTPGDFSGYLAEWDGVVYAADMWRYYKVGNAGSGWKPGDNHVYRVEKGGLQKVGTLPYMYAPADFFVRDDEMYTISMVWGQLNRASVEGELLEELLTDTEAQSRGMYLCMQNEDTFYLAEPGGWLWKIFRSEGE